MDLAETDSNVLNSLRQKIVNAERKYYSSLHVLQEKLSRLEAIQALSEVLIACTDSTEALDKLLENTIQFMGVEKAVVAHQVEGGYRVGAVKGYSRKQVKELQQKFIPEENGDVVEVTAEKLPKRFDNTHGKTANALCLSQMIVCPLQSEEGVLFGLYIVGFSAQKENLFRPFDISDLDFFDTVAHLASIAIIRSKLIESRLEQQRLETQLAAAEKIQSSFWPSTPELGCGSHVWATCTPAAFVGGDLYDFFPMNDGSWVFYVADVSDKGLPAAMIMVALWSKIRSEVYLHQDIEQLLGAVNDKMYALLSQEGFFATIILGRYWPDGGRLSLVRGGHLYPLLIRNGRQKQLPKLKGMTLGLTKSATYRKEEISLLSGDSIVFFTDGLTDAENENCELFGEARVNQYIQNISAAPLGTKLLGAVNNWQGDTKPSDDLTILEIWRD